MSFVDESNISKTNVFLRCDVFDNADMAFFVNRSDFCSNEKRHKEGLHLLQRFDSIPQKQILENSFLMHTVLVFQLRDQKLRILP